MDLRFSTRQAAKKLGLGHTTLVQYVEAGKVPAPKSIIPGERSTHLWTEAEIEHVRQLLPKIANGRKTRYQKIRETKKDAQPRAAVPHKQRKPKKK
jgi:predicted DNA-binding transcriptional regulator AlpA